MGAHVTEMSSAPVVRKERRLSILFVTAQPPVPVRDGMTNKTFELLARLQDRADVELFTFCTDETGVRGRVHRELPRLSRVEAMPVRRRRRISPTLLTPMRRYSASYSATGLRLSGTRWIAYDAIHLDTLPLGHLADAVRPLTDKLIWSINDAYSRTLMAIAAQGGVRANVNRLVLANTIARYERHCARQVDVVDVVSPQEEAYLRGIGIERVRVLPLGRPPVAAWNGGPPSPRGRYVVGIMSALGGVYGDAIADFLRKVWPRVVTQTGARLVLVGGLSGASRRLIGALSNAPAVETRERVEDRNEFYSAIDLAVVPVNYPVGLSTKALEALAAGRALVGGAALAALPTSWNDRAFVRRDTFEGMATSIIHLLCNEERRHSLGREARRLVQTWPTWDEYADRYLVPLP